MSHSELIPVPRRRIDYCLQVNSCLSHVFVSNILLETRHADSFTYCLRLPLAATAKFSTCNIDRMSRKVYSVYCVALYRKSLPIPGLEHQNNKPQTLMAMCRNKVIVSGGEEFSISSTTRKNPLIINNLSA